MTGRSTGSDRRTLLVLGLTITAVLTGARAHGASCDVTGGDAAAVTAARTAIQAACDCAAADSPATWGRCVRDTLRTVSGLSSACTRQVRRTELRSTCGRPGRTVCCRTSRLGRTMATLRPGGACHATNGGSSCESVLRYLDDDGCTASGCTPPVCGNGVVEQGESCDPPDGTTCDDTCAACPAGGCTVPGQHRFCGDGPVTPQCTTALAPRAACEAEGGCWDISPFHPEGLCNCPTLDAGKVCQTFSDCEGLCLGDGDGGIGSCEMQTSGACSETRMVYSCVCLAAAPGSFYTQCID